MGMAAILVMWPGPRKQTFVPPPHGCSTWNLTSIGPVVSEEKMSENVDRRLTTDNRRQMMTTEASHTISSPVSLRLRWAKKWPSASEEIVCSWMPDSWSKMTDNSSSCDPAQLTFTTLWADNKLIIFLFFPENRLWHFMQIVSYNLHEMPNPIFWEKYFKMSSAEKFTYHVSVKPTRVVRRQRSSPGRGDPIWQQSLEVIIVKKTVTDWLIGWLKKSGQNGKSQIKLRKGKTKSEQTHG